MYSERLERSVFGHWWWQIDRVVFFLVASLMLIGGLVATTSSGAVAGTYEVDPYYFARRQALFLLAALPVMMMLSACSVRLLKAAHFLLFLTCAAGLTLTLFIGEDVKGASRWITLAGFKLQPTEFMKPALIVVTAWLLATSDRVLLHKRFLFSLMLFGLIALQVLIQPNFGMFLVMGTVWFVQAFLAGVSLMILLPIMMAGLGFIGGGYFFFPHVRSRIERFLDPSSGDSYQVDRAREALLSGGFSGRGAGEGSVKYSLPDAHTDFVLAVIGEEFGMITCLFLLILYGAIVFRGFSRVFESHERFVLICGGGLLLQFALQVLVNVGVVLQVLPTTGMTLPFMSYGGSSVLSMALLVGTLLALTRKGRGQVKQRDLGR